MKKKYLMAALLCSVCVTGASLAGAGIVSAEETEGVTEAVTESSEEGTEAQSGEEESKAPAERPDYQALDYVTLGEYKGLKVEIDPAEFVISEDDIAARIREELQAADLFDKISDGQVQDGDIANIDYEGKLDGEAFDGGTAQGFDLEIGSHTFIDGFEDGLIGVSVGDTVDLPLTFPEYYGNEELAGKDVVFTVTVNSIQRMPELTDELAGKASSDEYPDAASYRGHVEEELQADMDSTKRDRIYGELLTLISNVSKVNDYPAELVEYTAENMKSYYRQYAEAYGMEFAEFLESFMGMTEDVFEEQIDAAVKQNLTQELLLKAIAETEKLEVSEEEFAAGCEKYAKEYGFETSEEFLNAYDEKVVRLGLLQDKVMEFVQNNATIEEITETEEETGGAGEPVSEENKPADEAESETEAVPGTEKETTAE